MTPSEIGHPRSRWPRRLAWILVAAGFLAACVWSVHFVAETLRCEPPTEAELRDQQRFVRTHLEDAASFDAEAMDCDDDGLGIIGFTIGRSPVEAQRRFLDDQSCGPTSEDGMGPGVRCRSGDFDVFIFFESRGSGSQGELTMERSD